MSKDRPAMEFTNSSQEIKLEPNNSGLYILESINGLILCCNSSGSLTFANKKVREMLGIKVEEVPELKIYDFVNPQEYNLLEKKCLLPYKDIFHYLLNPVFWMPRKSLDFID
ncbi:PAS domain-containing protein [Syntrophomonas wolfei]|uniref:PAS domain-containing protein n=1 Tax=Syntrophomonas wolfei TaxID=863 RepID=UPI00059CD8AE|nr:PAS domain-containing protein [Syntrophomonas wolfei]